MTSPTSVITIVGKPGCHLCDDARLIVEAVVGELRGGPSPVAVEVVERSILDDPALHERYWDEIPVVLIDDRVHTIWRVDADRLRAALTAG